MGKGGIILHPKYGVNPTILQCPICAGNTGEIALLGSAYKGKAPMHMNIGNGPCDSCTHMMKVGILIVSVKDGSDSKNPTRTGMLSSLTEEAFQRMFGDLPPNRAAFIEDGVWEKTGLKEQYLKQLEKQKEVTKEGV